MQLVFKFDQKIENLIAFYPNQALCNFPSAEHLMKDTVKHNELHLEGYKIECNKLVITKVIRYP
jgi:hypothetical protein